MSTTYSPTLRIASSTGLTYHIRFPDDTVACGRRIKDETNRSFLAHVERFGDWMVCRQCIARVGSYGPQRPSGRPHLSECPAYKGQHCICDEQPYPEWTSG